jgi:hypothetical protein
MFSCFSVAGGKPQRPACRSTLKNQDQDG